MRAVFALCAAATAACWSVVCGPSSAQRIRPFSTAPPTHTPTNTRNSTAPPPSHPFAAVPEPGAGLLDDGANAAPCAVGFYSYGYNRRPCARCPRSLTTAAAGAASKWDCACPPGYRYSDEAAVPCGYGYWRAGVGLSAACTPCGLGLTTPTVTAASQAECALAKPGYRLDMSGASVAAVACDAGL